jgi:2-furoyl-CoA dehydrogenase FAD binding subunit
MKPRPFDYVRPDTVEEILELLGEYGDDARILAGGQSLIPMLNLRLIDADVLIDISRIAELGVIRNFSEPGEVGGPVDPAEPAETSSRVVFRVMRNPHPGEKVEIGAAVTQNKLMAWPDLQQKLPLVAAALPFVGHFQTRNRGTVCGSIAHADPSSELPLALAVLGGDVVLRSRQRGERVLRAEEFQKDMLTTARAPDEMIAAVRFPVIARQGVAFEEVARRHGDFAIIAVAAWSTGKWVRVGVGGMAGRPSVASVRMDLVHHVPDWLERWLQQLEGYDDLHASAAMRRDIFKKLAPRVIEEAVRCAA